MPQLLFNTDSHQFGNFTFDDVVIDAAQSGRVTDFTFVVPTRRFADANKRRIVREYFLRTGKAFQGIPVHTMESLSQFMFERLAPARRQISPALQVVLIDRA